jgi:ankyrin repeat protein
VGRLLAEGADPNGAAAGETPAMAAAAAGACDCLELLLAAGADLERAVGAGGTALHCAAAAGQRLTVELLLRAGVAAGGARPDGQTAFLLAAEAGRLDITEMLREKQRRRARRSRGPPPPPHRESMVYMRALSTRCLLASPHRRERRWQMRKAPSWPRSWASFSLF